jgi:hypothetical protein
LVVDYIAFSLRQCCGSGIPDTGSKRFQIRIKKVFFALKTVLGKKLLEK